MAARCVGVGTAVVVVALLGGTAWAQDAGAPPPVVGGSQVSAGDWEDVAAVYIGGSVGCTGTLIAPKLVLTAGHCIGGITKVTLGTNDYRSGGESIRVRSEHEYPNSWSTVDVGLLILEEEATVAPRTIAWGCALDDLDDGESVQIVGYGATDIWGTQYGTKLMEATTTVNDHDCSELQTGCNGSVSPGGEISAGGNGIDACYGDSGGPLYLLTDHGDYLVGVTSRAYNGVWAPCQDGGIYGRPDAVLDWIETTGGVALDEPDCGEEQGGGGGDGGGGGGGGGGGDGGGDDESGVFDGSAWAPPILVPTGGESGTWLQTDGGRLTDEGGALAFTVTGPPEHGAVAVTGDGWVSFQADDDYDGDDLVTLVVHQASADPAQGTQVDVEITVFARDRSAARGCAAVGALGLGLGPVWLAMGLVVGRRREG